MNKILFSLLFIFSYTAFGHSAGDCEMKIKCGAATVSCVAHVENESTSAACSTGTKYRLCKYSQGDNSSETYICCLANGESFATQSADLVSSKCANNGTAL